MKIRLVTQDQLSRLKDMDTILMALVKELRYLGAPKAAQAVAKSRKSVGGAIRHAQRALGQARTERKSPSEHNQKIPTMAREAHSRPQ